MRNVTVNTVESNVKKVIATDVATYGELKSVLSENGISVENKSVIVAQTKVSLEVDAAVLPEGDFTLMIFPKTFKAGFYDSPEDYEDYSNSELVEEIEEELSQVNAKVEVLKARLASLPCEQCETVVASAPAVERMSDEDQALADDLKKQLGL